MSYDIVTGAFCASSYGIFEVPGSKPGVTYRVEFACTHGAFCTCTAFKFAPGDDKTCKHITYAYEHSCQYNVQWNEGHENADLTPIGYTYDAIIPGETCPVCGGPVVAVKIAV
jgi:hypothetical protein